MVYSDPNNTNSIVYQQTLLSYQLKTSHWNFSRASTLHLCNMADRGEKLQQLHCYYPFSDSRDTYLTKNHYENYSPKMVPTNPTGSRTNMVWHYPLNGPYYLSKIRRWVKTKSNVLTFNKELGILSQDLHMPVIGKILTNNCSVYELLFYGPILSIYLITMLYFTYRTNIFLRNTNLIRLCNKKIPS